MNDSRSPDDDFSALFNDSLKAGETAYAPGDRVRAEILALGAEDAIVALGPGKEGAVAARVRAGRKAGEMVDLCVTAGRPSEFRLSVNPTDKNIALDL